MSKNVLDAAFINNDMAFKHFLANKYAIYIHKLIFRLGSIPQCLCKSFQNDMNTVNF